jgi:hypothetical protein
MRHHAGHAVLRPEHGADKAFPQHDRHEGHQRDDHAFAALSCQQEADCGRENQRATGFTHEHAESQQGTAGPPAPMEQAPVGRQKERGGQWLRQGPFRGLPESWNEQHQESPPEAEAVTMGDRRQ